MDIWACAMPDTLDRCSSTIFPWSAGVWKEVSCLDVWRLVNHHAVTNGNAECHTPGLKRVFCSNIDDFNIRSLTSAHPIRMLQSQNKRRAAFMNWLCSCLLQHVHSEGPDMSSDFMPNWAALSGTPWSFHRVKDSSVSIFWFGTYSSWDIWFSCRIRDYILKILYWLSVELPVRRTNFVIISGVSRGEGFHGREEFKQDSLCCNKSLAFCSAICKLVQTWTANISSSATCSISSVRVSSKNFWNTITMSTPLLISNCGIQTVRHVSREPRKL
jgi:hypothetical protein